MHSLRGILVERGAPKPGRQSTRPARTIGTLCGLHPDSQQRPPSLPRAWIAGLGSTAPIFSILAEDGSSWKKMRSTSFGEIASSELALRDDSDAVEACIDREIKSNAVF